MTRNLYKLIKISKTGIHVTATAEAPAGYIWKASRTHEIVSSGYTSKGINAILRKDLEERIDYGIEQCTDPDCDWCNNY